MPDDGLWTHTGRRLQGHLMRGVDLRGRTMSRGSDIPELGVVIARYYKDEDGSGDYQFTVYDVFLPRVQVILNRVPTMAMYQGNEGGSQVTLHPASELPDVENPANLWNSVMESDGDLVAICWVGGRYPHIMGCVNHVRTAGEDGAEWYGDSNDGEISAHRYNTTNVKIDSDGNIVVDMDDTAAPPDRSLIINAGSKQLLKVSYDDGASEVRIELGSGSTLEKVVLGESFKTFFDSEVHNHVHDAGSLVDGTATPCTGSTGPAVSELPDSGPDNCLTEKVKAEK